ncbi:MAG: N-acetylmuramoyl-L-alanine amidase [Clostridia bacterium]|nr:N-acetylmuramoyl-L-alanine amidase [Clostridia bacterium]
MALKRLIAGSLMIACILCGCGNQQSGAGQAGSGSGEPQHVQDAAGSGSAGEDASIEDELVDPPLGDEAASKEVEALPLSGLVICLDPGHGITSASKQEQVSPVSSETKPAYVSGAEGNSQTEEALNLAVAQMTRTELESLGAQVVMTRETDEATVSNIERAQIANQAQADLCIRIHADGSDDSSVYGMSMQVPSGSLLGTPSIEAPSAQAAEIILQTVTEATGARNRGLVQRSDLTGFNWSEVPCILLEMGFLSNADEDAKLAAQEYRQQIASGIAEGVCRWVSVR